MEGNNKVNWIKVMFSKAQTISVTFMSWEVYEWFIYNLHDPFRSLVNVYPGPQMFLIVY